MEDGGRMVYRTGIQMHAAEIYLGVGRLHPRVSLQFEMRMHGMGGYTRYVELTR